MGSLVLFLASALQTPQEDPSAACAANLKALWGLQVQYTNQFGGRMKVMPAETGPAFWLKLTQTTPPLIPESALAKLVCPLSKAKPRPGFTTYRGPAQPVNRVMGAVGCCDPGDHPDRTITILYKGGEVKVSKPGDPEYEEALDSTAGTPERQEVLVPGRVKGALKKILTAQADFRANDRDNNKAQDFWVRDVSMLYRFPLPSDPLNGIRLIPFAVAAADAAPLPESPEMGGPVVSSPVPYNGYFFKTLKSCKVGGKTSAYDDGSGRNPARFGVVAYPAQVAVGRLTYVANENNTLFGADLGGKLLDSFPSDDELKKDWKKLD